MAFLYISPDDFSNELQSRYGGDVSAATFRCQTTFVRTDEGRAFHEWMISVGESPELQTIERWIGGIDEIAIMGFGHDYALLSESLPHAQREDLDAFYGPIRTAAFRPKKPVSDAFDCSLLKALGVDFAFSPTECRQMYEIGEWDPFVSHFAIAYKDPGERAAVRIDDLISDKHFRNLLGRYDASTHILRAAYRLGCRHDQAKHLLVTYHW